MLENDGKRAILSQAGETWIDIGAERIGVNLEFGLLTFLRNGKWGLIKIPWVSRPVRVPGRTVTSAISGHLGAS